MVDGTEALTRAIVGQQISVAGARTVLGRLAATLGDPLTNPVDGLTRTFPSAESIACAPDTALPVPATRRGALREACRRVAAHDLVIDAGADRQAMRAALTSIRGIGPWTAEYVAMRALGDPDAFPASDLGVRQGLARLGLDTSSHAVTAAADSWRPWRAYATHHLWNHLGDR
jgi:AraC family transcriptional regulator of adaptative response / DNA-3-methyladenine glycosylase II